MRRALIGILALVGGLVLVLGGSGSEYERIDVVFDTAKGLVPGQVVKVAGSEVGEIEQVELIQTESAGYRARLTLTVDEQFTPFRNDASCQILPQGLLSENFVECDPGSPSRPELPPGETGVATVAVERTSIPASLQDLLKTFSMPTSQQLGLLLGQLGLGTAGRGEDVNEILRRANPALAQADAVLARIAAQRDQLRAAVEDTDEILEPLAKQDEGIRRFVTGAADTAETTALRRTQLREAIRLLPGTLDSIETTLPPLRRASHHLAPLLRRLGGAAPTIESFQTRLTDFEQEAQPALGALGDAAEVGRRAVGSARPIIKDLRRLARISGPTLRNADRLLTSGRDQGAFESFNRWVYGMSTGAGIYDETGHLIPIFVDANSRCIEASTVPGTQVEPGCSHAYSSPGFGREPITQLPPGESGTSRKRVDRKSLNRLLDYLLK